MMDYLEIIDYFGIMVEKFKASETTLRKILSEEFDRRFKKAQETRDKFK